MRFNFKIFIRIPLSIILLSMLSATSCSTGRSQIRIDNLETTRLESVMVYVNGRRYDIGNIEADSSKTIIIKLESQSELEIEFSSNAGVKKKLKTNFNQESGYIGFILVRIKNESIVHAEKDYESLWW